MPLVRCPQPFSDPNWLYEIKWDGFRALALIEDGHCRLISRNGNDFNSFEPLREAIPQEMKTKNAVLDGEIVVLDDSGRTVFNDLLFRRGEPRFYAFDILWCEGKDLRFEGLRDRKRKLRASIPSGNERLLYCDHIEERGEELFRRICELNMEGIVAKRRNSPYLPNNSDCHWVKIKNREYSQLAGRDDLFAPSRDPEPMPEGWSACALACAEAEL